MNIRKPLSVLAFVAFAAPLAAHADAPSGEFYEMHQKPSAERQAIPVDRDEGRQGAEFSAWTLIDASRATRTVITRDDVRRELALSPLPDVKA
jgi:hypothetical protein